MPVSFVLKYILPTIKVQKALKLHADNNLPGGVETAMLFSIFDQSVMDLNRPVSNNLAETTALRAMVTHTRDDSVHQISQMKEGTRGLTKGLVSALQQLNKATQLAHLCAVLPGQYRSTAGSTAKKLILHSGCWSWFLYMTELDLLTV
jgi:hypothetical protein